MHLMNISDKSTKDAVTVLLVGKQKVSAANTMMKKLAITLLIVVVGIPFLVK